jgi:hypothetical protein
MNTLQVGHQPTSVPLVWRTHVNRSQHSPFRIVPHLGQVSENTTKPPKSEGGRVFHKREGWSYFTDDSGHFHPQSASLTVKTCSVSCD